MQSYEKKGIFQRARIWIRNESGKFPLSGASGWYDAKDDDIQMTGYSASSV
jgi:hypothetical protein